MSKLFRSFRGFHIKQYRPVTFLTENNAHFLFLGIDNGTSYFKITYIGDNRIDGIFKTSWVECCGDKTAYDVHGDFSIPDIRYLH